MARRAREVRRFRDELLDELLAGADPAEVFADGGVLDDLKKAVAERALDAEMDAHLDRERSGGNHRNGHNRKRVLTDEGALELAVPRDRAGSFEPQLVEKYCRRLPGFDDKVISMYARGMTTREIRGHIEELYGVSVSAELVSKVTDAVLDEVGEWQSRPLEETYAIMYFDAVRVKIRDEGLVRNKAVYLAVGVSCGGRKEVLGLWIEQTEGAKFWLSVMNELRARGVTDVLIAVVDGLKGFPEAIEAVYPEATVQTCIVHLIRRSLAYASYQERRELAAALKTIYRAPTQAAAEAALDAFEAGPWGAQVPRDRAELAQRLGAGDCVLRVLAADPSGDLHDQRGREPEQHGAPSGAHPGALPQRPRGDEAGVLGVARGAAQVAGAASSLASGASGTGDPFRRAVRSGGVVTGPAISTACPPALGRVRGPAPVDSPWKSLRAPARGESRSASSGRSAPSCYSAGHPTGPNKHHRGSPNTEFLTPPERNVESGSLGRSSGSASRIQHPSMVSSSSTSWGGLPLCHASRKEAASLSMCLFARVRKS